MQPRMKTDTKSHQVEPPVLTPSLEINDDDLKADEKVIQSSSKSVSTN